MAPKRRSRAYFWRPSPTADEDKQIGNWLYITPRFPDGVLPGDLARESYSIQYECALFWFLQNLKPYHSPSKDDMPRIKANIVSGDQSFQEPLTALSALEYEFEQALSSKVKIDLSERLPGYWTWNNSSLSNIDEDDNDFYGRGGEARAIDAIMRRLDEMEAAIRSLDLSFGKIGHNQLASDEVVGHEEKRELLTSIRDGKAELEIGNLSSFRARWPRISELCTRFGKWSLKLCSMFIEGVISKGGETTGKVIPWIVAAAGAGLLSHAHDITVILEKISHHN